MQASKGTTEKTPPPQTQEDQPGIQSEMTPAPKSGEEKYVGANKLKGKVALITGGDSGIGRSVAVMFAKEGADVCCAYYNAKEKGDADETKRLVEAEGRRCITVEGDIGDESYCQRLVQQCVDQLGHLDILVNNAAEQTVQKSIEDITTEQLERTFRTNIFSMFWLTKAAMPHLKEGSSIINTTSVTAYKGHMMLLDYSTTKGAIVSFTRSLSQMLAEKGIRVNAVAPGPIWTPLIPATFPEEKVAKFGENVPMKRMGQPEECAPSYVFLASKDASYITGQVLHPNGGTLVGS